MATRPPILPPVRPLSELEPWNDPQTLLRGRATLRPRLGPLSIATVPGQLVAPGSLPSSDAGEYSAPSWTAEAHRYARIISGVFGVGLASARVLDAPTTYRNLLAFRNLAAAATMFIEFGRDASTQSVFTLAPGQFLLLDTVVPQDDVYVLSTVAAQQIAISYSTVALPAAV